VSWLCDGMDELNLTYVGPARDFTEVAQEFRERGIAIKYVPPMENKDAAAALAAISLAFSATGSIPDMLAAAHALRRRNPRVRVEGLPVVEATSIRERLQELEVLHAEGVISDEERAQQRGRILEEI
jgi:hypothetical protein